MANFAFNTATYERTNRCKTTEKRKTGERTDRQTYGCERRCVLRFGLCVGGKGPGHGGCLTERQRGGWVHCPGHAGVKGNDKSRSDRLAGKATITGGLRLGLS